LVYSPPAEEAVLCVSVHPCAAEEESDHYEWFYEGSRAHDGELGAERCSNGSEGV
jgi:hypothetical protein